MATVVETHTSDSLAQGQETNGALVHQPNQNQEIVQPNPAQHSVVSRQPRPQSAVFAPVAGVEEDRPGAKKTQAFLPWYTRWGYNISLGAAQGLLVPASFVRDTQDAIRSPLHNPDMTRTYECRKTLPIR